MASGNRIGHEGIVKRIGQNTVDVIIVSRSACGSCQAKSMCGMAEAVQKTITARRPGFPLRIGEKVKVYAGMGNAAYSVVLAYVLPSVLLVGAIGGITGAGYDEIYAATGALGGLAAYFCIQYLFRKKVGKRIRFSIEKTEESAGA